MWHTWQSGPLGIDIAPHGINDKAREGIMLTKTPGRPFPPTVTAGMLIDSANGIPLDIYTKGGMQRVI